MPKLPVSPLRPGWQLATVEGVVFRPSTSAGNPMLQVEVSLESGQLTDIYLVVTTDGSAISRFLYVLGFTEVYRAITGPLKKRSVPSFDLDEIIGKQLKVYIPEFGMIKDFVQVNSTTWNPRPTNHA